MQEVRIIAKRPAIDITVPMGDGPARLPGDGLGGWGSVPRAENVDLSTWEGQPPLKQDVPLLLDGWGLHPRSVQHEWSTILKLGRDNTGNEYAPPVFQVWGPVEFPGKWWVLPENGIEPLTDEDDVIKDNDGTLYRQAFILHMEEYVHDVFGRRRKKPEPNQGVGDQKKGPGVGGATPLTHTTSKGETFCSIAKDVFGDWTLWSQIAELNPGFPRGPFNKLPGGHVLRLPPA